MFILWDLYLIAVIRTNQHQEPIIGCRNRSSIDTPILNQYQCNYIHVSQMYDVTNPDMPLKYFPINIWNG